MICGWILWIWSLSPSKHPCPDHAPIVIVIQSEHLKHSVSPRNQSAKHLDSGCFGISGVVIGSALSKGWRSGPEAFRAGHFLRLDRNRKPRMKSLWHPRYTPPDLLARISKVNPSNAKKFGLICFPRIFFRGLIYCDHEPLWLLNVIKNVCYFLGCTCKAINSM